LPIRSLGHVLVYAFEASDGVYLVDSGWNTDDCWESLTGGLEQVGYAMTDVRGVLVTHVHPDHYGLTGRIRETSGAWVALHSADAALVDSDFLMPTDQQPDLLVELRAAGVPADHLCEVQGEELPESGYVTRVVPDILLEDHQQAPVPGWDIRIIWTPGHCPGHVCFALPDHRMMLTGDQVLPKITPNVSVFACTGDDPLGDYLASLTKLSAFPGDVVLPAHEYEFSNLHERIDELHAHHAARLDDVRAALGDGRDTAWRIASKVRWSVHWDAIDSLMKRSALGETLAHLIYLEKTGQAGRTPSVPEHWFAL
jgi:glyoxylase-like metal-dependent hydrolase (beta-lactamase superfamily II)